MRPHSARTPLRETKNFNKFKSLLDEFSKNLYYATKPLRKAKKDSQASVDEANWLAARKLQTLLETRYEWLSKPIYHVLTRHPLSSTDVDYDENLTAQHINALVDFLYRLKHDIHRTTPADKDIDTPAIYKTLHRLANNLYKLTTSDIPIAENTTSKLEILRTIDFTNPHPPSVSSPKTNAHSVRDFQQNILNRTRDDFRVANKKMAIGALVFIVSFAFFALSAYLGFAPAVTGFLSNLSNMAREGIVAAAGFVSILAVEFIHRSRQNKPSWAGRFLRLMACCRRKPKQRTSPPTTMNPVFKPSSPAVANGGAASETKHTNPAYHSAQQNGRFPLTVPVGGASRLGASAAAIANAEKAEDILGGRRRSDAVTGTAPGRSRRV